LGATALTSFQKRVLEFQFTLGQGNFGNSGSNKLILSGLRATVQVSQANTNTPSQAVAVLYGLSLDHMNTLTQAGLLFATAKNGITINAGNAGGTLPTIFDGTIWEAYPRSNQPEVPFIITANPASLFQLQPVPAQSFKGSISITQALTQIVASNGFTVQASNVNATLSNPNFSGTVWEQVKAACTAANVQFYLDMIAKILYVWSNNGSRGGAPFIISPDTGMIDYPEFMKNRIRIRTLFDPTLKGPGALIQVISQFVGANGVWHADQIDYNLSSEMPGGPWEMSILASRT
jgi:hypothetical protein